MVSKWSLSDSKSPQVSRTLLSILSDLNYAVVWMVSTPPLISESSSPCTNPLVTVARAPITISILVTFMVYNFFSWQQDLGMTIIIIIKCKFFKPSVNDRFTQ